MSPPVLLATIPYFEVFVALWGTPSRSCLWPLFTSLGVALQGLREGTWPGVPVCPQEGRGQEDFLSFILLVAS